MAYLRLRNLSVEFPMYQGSYRSLKKHLLKVSLQGNLARDSADRINLRALSDLTLDIEDGDRIGLWATTAPARPLLKVLAGIYLPRAGRSIWAERFSCSR
jgi:ABC-type polysaccharide/polyol phosphate transport system ATPase subunit